MISQAEAIGAVGLMSGLKYFPSQGPAWTGIAYELTRFVDTVEQLDWLVAMVLQSVAEWPGPKEFRGLFCTRFKPADGIEATCYISGFTPEDCEAAASYQLSEGPRVNTMLGVGEVAEMIDGEHWDKIGQVEIDPGPREGRTEEELRHEDSIRHLADVLGELSPKAIHLPGTRKRNAAENAKLEQQLKEDLERRRRA